MDMQLHKSDLGRKPKLIHSLGAFAGLAVRAVVCVAVLLPLHHAQAASAEQRHNDDAVITVTASAKADFVTPTQRRAQLRSAAETVPRERSAESASDGRAQPHYVTYDFGYGWRYKMTNSTHQMIIQNEFLLEKLSAMEEGLDGRFKRFLLMDTDSLIGEDGYRVITRDEARAALHASEVQYKLEVLGANLPAEQRKLQPTPAHGQGNSPNYELYRQRQSVNAGLSIDAGSGIAAPSRPQAPAAQPSQAAPAPEAIPEVVQPSPLVRKAPPTANFPSLQAAEPVQTVPTLDAATRPVVVTPLPTENTRRGPLRDGVVVPVAPGQPSISREVYEVEDLEPPLNKAVKPTAARSERPRPSAPEAQAPVGRAALPAERPNPSALNKVVAQPSQSASAEKPTRSPKSVRPANLPAAPAPPPPPPGLFGDAQPQAKQAAARAADTRPALVQQPRRVGAARFPSGVRRQPVSIPAAPNRARQGAKAERATIAPEFGHADRLTNDSWKEGAVKPTLTIEPATGDGPSAAAYRSKHEGRARVAPVFHTDSDQLWKRHGADSGDQALVAQ